MLFVRHRVQAMLRHMPSLGTLKLTQHRCIVEPSDTTVVALSLFGGVAEPVGPGKDLPIALRVMSGVLNRYVLASGLTEPHGDLTGTSTRMVNCFSGANLAAVRGMYGVLDVVTASYYGRNAATGRNISTNTAYATLSIASGVVDDVFLSLNGTHHATGLLATTWRSRTSQEAAQLHADTMVGLVGKVARVHSPGRGLAYVYANSLFGTRTAQPEQGRGTALFPTRFAPDRDPAWSLKPGAYGTDLHRDVTARELETTAAHRVVELDMRDYSTELGGDEP